MKTMMLMAMMATGVAVGYALRDRGKNDLVEKTKQAFSGAADDVSNAAEKAGDDFADEARQVQRDFSEDANRAREESVLG